MRCLASRIRSERVAAAARFLVLAVVVLAAWLALAAPADAHRTSLGAAKLSVTQNVVKLRLTLSAHDLAFALGGEVDASVPVPSGYFAGKRDRLSDYVAGRVTVSSQSGPCAADEPLVMPVGTDDTIAIDLAFSCAAPTEFVTVRYLLFFDFDPRHRAVGTFEQGGPSEQFVLDAAFNELTFELARIAPKPWFETFAALIWIGVEHILFGLDHVLFLVVLLMLPARPASLVATVTGFTIAHSVTLALAWFDLITVPGRIVEALIAFSIAVVAVENLFRKSGSRRWIEASLFGLVHGLGFYGSLKSLELAGAGMVSRLVGFNLGVELGQLAIVAVTLMPLTIWWRQSWYRRSAIFLSLVLIAVALHWTIERLGG